MMNTWIVLTIWGLFYFGSFLFLNAYSGESKAISFFKFLFFLIILSLVFLPGITGHYLFHDDVFLWQWQKTDWTTHPQYVVEGLIGRPLARIMRFSVESIVDNVSDANVVRFLTIIVISLTALSLDVWFRMVCGASKKMSFLLSLSMVTLPPFQIYVHWMNSYPMAVAILLSVFSAIVLLKPRGSDTVELEFRTISSLKTEQGNTRSFALLKNVEQKFPVGVLLSFSLLTISLLIYQPAAPFFIALLTFWLIGLDSRNLSKVTWPLLHLIIFMVTLGVYLFVFKMVVPVSAMGEHSIYSNALVSNYTEKLLWIFREPVIAILNLWHVFPSRAVAIIILLIIVLGVALEFIHLLKSDDHEKFVLMRNFLWKYSAIIVFIFLSSGVVLAIKSADGMLYRAAAPQTAVIFILMWHSIKNIFSTFVKKEKREIALTFVLFLIGVVAMFMAHHTFKKYCVDMNALELKHIENELSQKYNAQIKTIHVIRPAGVSSTDVKMMDEFGYTTCFFPTDVPWLVKAAIQEKGIYIHNRQELVVTSGTEEVIIQDPHVLTINLRRIQ